MELKSRNSGISLISLIITIIVIIILAAIVIFSGMGTPEKAQLSKVISDIDSVQTAVDQAYYGLYTEKAVAGEVWAKSQFYEAVATGKTNRDELNGTGLIEIADSSLVKINLPKYEGRKWYVAVSDMSDTVKTGSAVLSPGFESDGKVYATLLDVQNGGGDGSGLNGGGLTEEEEALLASINIGDYVNYMGTNVDSGEGIGGEGDESNPVYWRVIDKDEEKGEILITTSQPVGNLPLSGADDFLNIANEEDNVLDKYCQLHYSGDGINPSQIKSMRIEDMDKLCRRYPITGENEALSIGKLPLGDLDALAELYYGEGNYGRYAYYAKNTPDNLVEDVEVTTKDGNTVTYHGVKLSYDGKFLRYDNERGETQTVKTSEEAKEPIYIGATSEGEIEPQSMARATGPTIEDITCEPVLVSMDFYGYAVPDEVAKIIGDVQSPSWLASACVDTRSGGAYFGVRGVYGGYVGAYLLCYSGGYEGGGGYAVRPVVSLSSKLLEKCSEDGEGTREYNVWKLK